MRFALVYTKYGSPDVKLCDTIEEALEEAEARHLPRRTYGEQWAVMGLMPRAEHFLSAGGQHLVKFEQAEAEAES